MAASCRAGVLLAPCLLLLLLAAQPLDADQRAPTAQMYSRHPSQNGKANILHCYTDGFHPPKITITLLKNGQPMPDVTASDLSFGTDWSFNRLVYAPFTPSSGDEYTCRVEHSALAQPLVVKWDSDY